MKKHNIIISTGLAHFPAVEGIYLFGSHAENAAKPDSDTDIALLLPHDQAKKQKNLIAGLTSRRLCTKPSTC